MFVHSKSWASKKDSKLEDNEDYKRKTTSPAYIVNLKLKGH